MDVVVPDCWGRGVSAVVEICGHRLSWVTRTDVGKVRKVNEDSVLASNGLFVVADGMGGHAAGDIASKLTVDTFLERFGSEVPPIAGLAGVIELANATVIDRAIEHHREGMDSTLVDAALSDTGATVELVVFHVGDSRCYVHEKGVFRQVTRHHSEVQELVDNGAITLEQAANHPHRNVVTRAIGVDHSVFADFLVLRSVPRRRLLLCSDGVSGEVSFAEMDRLAGDESLGPDEVADRLMAAVLAGHAVENATLIVVDVEQPLWEQDDLDVTGPRAGSWASALAAPGSDAMISDVPPSGDGVSSRSTVVSELIDHVPT